MLSIIAAIGQNRELGVNNRLPWNIPEDLKHFHDITINHPVIMGRKTHESIGRILSGRTNIIITRDREYQVKEGIITHSLEEAIHIINNNEIFIIGGGDIFKQALLIVDRLYLTIVHKSFREADTFFPDYKEFTNVISKEDRQSNGFDYTYLILEKTVRTKT